MVWAGLFLPYITGHMMTQDGSGWQGFNKSPQPFAVRFGLFLLGGVLPVDIYIAPVRITSAALSGSGFALACPVCCKGHDKRPVKAGA